MESRHILIPTLVLRKQLPNICQKAGTMHNLTILASTLPRAKLVARLLDTTGN